MKKEHLIALIVILVLAAGMAFFGRTSSTPEDGTAKIKSALKAREVPVVVATEGKGADVLAAMKSALAGLDRTCLISVDIKNPVERETAANFAQAKLPLIMVLGLDGKPAYHGTAPVEAEKIKLAVTEGLTRKPVKIPDESEAHEHHH